jgi:D-alanyl-D-alanine carboxypeptidase
MTAPARGMMKHSSRTLFAAASVVALMAFGAPAFAADTASLAAAIDKAAAASVAAGESPGLQVAVFKDGKPVLVKGYGKANLETGTPVTNDSVFKIGSVTKQFTAVALVLLAEEGKLSLSDKLSKYYPDYPRAGDITLEQMLHHTSGLHNYTAEPETHQAGMVHRTTDEMVAFMAKKMSKTMDFEPGTDWNYSNSAYFLLGGVVEKVSGQPLPTVFKTRFFDPLGMTHTALDDEADIVSGRASGYAAEGPGKFKNAGFIDMTYPGGAGSIRSTASDLAKWDAALFGGKVVKPASLTAMTTPGKLNDGSSSSTAIAKMYAAAGMPANHVEYGYALMLSDVGGHWKVDHGGGIDGFNASNTVFPKDHVSVTVLSNTIGKDVGAKVADKIERLAIGLPAEASK